MALLRRGFISGSAAALAFPTPLLAPPIEGRQFHNDVVGSPLDVALRALWGGVRESSGGALLVSVHADNAGIPGGDPQALEMLANGSLQFFTVNGAIASSLAPLASFQTLPYVFRDHVEVYRAIDGAPGNKLIDAFRATPVMTFPGATFENGFREISTTGRPIRTVADVAGLRWRTPRSELFGDFVRALGATPVIVNLVEMPAALQNGTAQAQDNPLSFIANQHLERFQKYVDVTDHMWAGFIFLANRSFFARVPRSLRNLVEEYLGRAVHSQRAAQRRYNDELPSQLRARDDVRSDRDRRLPRQAAGVLRPLAERLRHGLLAHARARRRTFDRNGDMKAAGALQETFSSANGKVRRFALA